LNEDTLYTRQSTLKLDIPESVAIVGVGGVGSWVAFNLALVGVRKISLYDFDNLELSNLNRTPYKINQVGSSKVSGLTELIKERRPDCEVLPFVKKIVVKEDFETDYDILVDTRDTEPMDGSIITGGYDGESITLHFNPKQGSVWGEGVTRYRVVPSYVVPPQLIANLITAYICGKKSLRGKVASEGTEKITNFSINKMLADMIKPKRRPTGKHSSKECKSKPEVKSDKKKEHTFTVTDLQTDSVVDVGHNVSVRVEPIE